MSDLVRIYVVNDHCLTCGGRAKMSPLHPFTSAGPACNDTWHRLESPTQETGRTDR